MKGNHNARCSFAWMSLIVFNKSKIQNERKSQRPPDFKIYFHYCVQQVKDTK